eukprot:CAMPEP_0114548228 /NCGR_PEP_ID=MMETSP0114-20121206/4871_1 /TAXON_ID=31324 /ORGANISM="Goniomonas sp, Strain m" /LENGTH=406 /DNA_ID=CAMNT_0001732807 /DNA_START=32 /DNA_END=1252 /DNA_ORIENTATION=-
MTWCNEHLKKCEGELKIEVLNEDFKDGIKLIAMLEQITGQKVGRYNKNPRMVTQMYDNTSVAFSFLAKDGVKLVNIGNTDITDGNLKLTKGLVWSLMEHYLFGKPYAEAKSELLDWVQSKIPEYNITAFHTQWNDGKALLALCDAISPGLYPDHQDLSADTALQNVTEGMALALQHYFIPKLLTEEEVISPSIAEPSLVCYLTPFMKAKPVYVNQARRTRAEGPGVTAGRVKKENPFKVITPLKDSGKLEIKITQGAKEIPCTVGAESAEGVYDCAWTTDDAGDYVIAVTLDGEHIRKSPFSVTCVESEASQCEATGRGISLGMLIPVGFRVKTPGPDSGKLEVKVVGSSGDDVPCSVNHAGDGLYEVTYLPHSAGLYKVHVTLDSEHVPNSPFDVNVNVGPVQWE